MGALVRQAPCDKAYAGKGVVLLEKDIEKGIDKLVQRK